MLACAFVANTTYAQIVVTYVPQFTFHGESAGDSLGGSVSGAGDVNGDSVPDFIVGAVRGGDNFSGRAHVFSGADGSVLHTFEAVDEDVLLNGFGNSVSGLGDVNGDGFADLVVGGPGEHENGTNSGSFRVISGLNGDVLRMFYGESAGDSLGVSVSGAGDVNGDGVGDLIVGAHLDSSNGIHRSGSAFVRSGVDGNLLYTFHGESVEALFGSSVSGAGDVNGDGFADLIVGESDVLGGGGRAHVFSGADGSVLYALGGDDSLDDFGGSVSGAGDINGDGFADFIVGARLGGNNGFNSGNARVFSGADGSVLYYFDGNVGDQFGGSVSGAGDVNGDGFADFIVGARLDENNGSSSGRAQVFSGADGSVLYSFDGDDSQDQFGSSVSGVGDVNGDGLADFIVGATSGGSNDGGYARVFVSQIREQVSDIDGSLAQVSILNGGLLIYGMQPFAVTDSLATADALEYKGFFSAAYDDFSNNNQTILDVRTWNSGFIYFSTAADALSGTPTARFEFNPLESYAPNGQQFQDLIVESQGPNGETHHTFDPVANLGRSKDDDPYHELTEVFDLDIMLTLQNDTTSTLGNFLTAHEGQTLYLSSVVADGEGYYGIAAVLSPGAVGIAGGSSGFGSGFGFEVEEDFAHSISAVTEPTILGDVNLDGEVTFADIPAFIEVLLSGEFQAEADCDGSGVIDFSDIPAFIDILLAG